MRASVFSQLSLVVALAASPALAQDNPGAHQHGHAKLQIALDAEQIDLLLVSPAYNLVGFEHRPRTREQQQTLDDVKARVTQHPMINTPDGRCTVLSGSLHMAWPADDDQANNHDHDHQQSAGHSDMEISQTLSCPGLTPSPQLETALLEQFPAMAHLNVQWLSAQGQGSTRLSRGENRFRPGQ